MAVKQVSLSGSINAAANESPADKSRAAAAVARRLQLHVQALEEEVILLQQLDHPNIVRYLGTEKTEDALNIFLEYVPGGSIASLLTRFGSFKESVIKVYTKQIITGLEYLHSHGIIHRDIKGANILVDNTGLVKLADFGASKRIENIVTMESGFKSVKGTPYWMAPEVIRQEGHGRQADIWSVACTVIEMATGRPPWSQYGSQVSAMFAIAQAKGPPTIPEGLSAECKDFLYLCFNRDWRKRPTASNLLHHPFLAGVARRTVAAPMNNLAVIVPLEVETSPMEIPSPSKNVDIDGRTHSNSSNGDNSSRSSSRSEGDAASVEESKNDRKASSSSGAARRKSSLSSSRSRGSSKREESTICLENDAIEKKKPTPTTATTTSSVARRRQSEPIKAAAAAAREEERKKQPKQVDVIVCPATAGPAIRTTNSSTSRQQQQQQRYASYNGRPSAMSVRASAPAFYDMMSGRAMKPPPPSQQKAPEEVPATMIMDEDSAADFARNLSSAESVYPVAVVPAMSAAKTLDLGNNNDDDHAVVFKWQDSIILNNNNNNNRPGTMTELSTASTTQLVGGGGGVRQSTASSLASVSHVSSIRNNNNTIAAAAGGGRGGDDGSIRRGGGSQSISNSTTTTSSINNTRATHPAVSGSATAAATNSDGAHSGNDGENSDYNPMEEPDWMLHTVGGSVGGGGSVNADGVGDGDGDVHRKHGVVNSKNTLLHHSIRSSKDDVVMMMRSSLASTCSSSPSKRPLTATSCGGEDEVCWTDVNGSITKLPWDLSSNSNTISGGSNGNNNNNNNNIDSWGESGEQGAASVGDMPMRRSGSGGSNGEGRVEPATPRMQKKLTPADQEEILRTLKRRATEKIQESQALFERSRTVSRSLKWNNNGGGGGGQQRASLPTMKADVSYYR